MGSKGMHDRERETALPREQSARERARGERVSGSREEVCVPLLLPRVCDTRAHMFPDAPLSPSPSAFVSQQSGPSFPCTRIPSLLLLFSLALVCAVKCGKRERERCSRFPDSRSPVPLMMVVFAAALLLIATSFPSSDDANTLRSPRWSGSRALQPLTATSLSLFRSLSFPSLPFA